MTITLDGNVIAEVPRKEAAKAFAIQFGALYVFDKSFAVKKNEKNKKLLAIRNYFELGTFILLGIQSRTDERLKRLSNEVDKFLKEMKIK